MTVAKDRLVSEEEFHDRWAESVAVESVLVDASFESCTTPETRWILERLGDLSGATVLDVGCGLGEASVYFAKRGATVTACDLSGEMLAVVSKLADHHGVQVQTSKGAAEGLPFKDDSFDVVYAANLLHHGEIPTMLDEFRRVLKTGGRLATWDPLKHNPVIELYRWMATEVRTEDEHPLRMAELALFRERFQGVEFECHWFFTLLIFLKFFLIEGVHPNQERYWKKIVTEADRLAPLHGRLEYLDRNLLRVMPFLRRYCWNISLVCTK